MTALETRLGNVHTIQRHDVNCVPRCTATMVSAPIYPVKEAQSMTRLGDAVNELSWSDERRLKRAAAAKRRGENTMEQELAMGWKSALAGHGKPMKIAAARAASPEVDELGFNKSLEGRCFAHHYPCHSSRAACRDSKEVTADLLASAVQPVNSGVLSGRRWVERQLP